MPEPKRTVEIEVTFDVDSDTTIPDWSSVPGIASVDPPEVRELDALYLDTATAALARNRVAVRRRSGGPDEGWHIKGPLVDGARVELQWPLGSTADVPLDVQMALEQWTSEPLAPFARIRNRRIAYVLRAANGGVVAEMVDDHVHGENLRGGTTNTWREWEVELGEDAPHGSEERAALLEAVTTIARAAGARPSAFPSKLARTMGAESSKG